MQTINFKNQYLLYMALMVIYAVYLFAFQFASLAGIFAPYIFLCFAASNRGGRLSYLLLAGIFALGAAMVSLPLTAFFIGTAILPGLALIFFHRGGRPYSWKAVLLSPIPAVVITAAVLLFMPAIRSGLEDLIVKLIEQAAAPIGGIDAGKAQMGDTFAFYYNQRAAIAASFIALAPAFMYVSVAFVTYATEKVFYNIRPADILPLPDFLLAAVILSGLCLVIPRLGMEKAGWNGLVITGSLYFMRGFDIIRYYMNRWRIVMLVRVLLYILIFMQQFLNVAVAVLGFISIYKNPVRENETEQDKK